MHINVNEHIYVLFLVGQPSLADTSSYCQFVTILFLLICNSTSYPTKCFVCSFLWQPFKLPCFSKIPFLSPFKICPFFLNKSFCLIFSFQSFYFSCSFRLVHLAFFQLFSQLFCSLSCLPMSYIQYVLAICVFTVFLLLLCFLL